MDYLLFSPVHIRHQRRRPKSKQTVFKKGDKKWYWSPSRGLIEVMVIGVHHDAGEPYYTIMLPDGSEKGTIRCRLFNTIEDAARSFPLRRNNLF